MTTPPPPDQWHPPQAGSFPPHPGQGPWGPQPGWTPPPGPPPGKNNGLKWLLVAVAVLLVIAISIGATLLFTRNNTGDNPPTATGTQTSITGTASASDAGPVEVITDDVTCSMWGPIVTTLHAQENNGWTKRDPSIPATAWTPEQLAQHNVVAQGMRSAADQTVRLAKMTPHRAMRELYEQSIAYWRAYSEKIPTYVPSDNHLALAANALSTTIVNICAAIDYGSAKARGPLAGPAAQPEQPTQLSDLSDPRRVIESPPNPVCHDWKVATDKLVADTARWRATDPAIPASDWTTELRSINDEVAGVMSSFADEIQKLGQQSGSPTLDDLASLASQYRRAYVLSLPSYVPADNYLIETASQLVFAVEEACEAAEN